MLFEGASSFTRTVETKHTYRYSPPRRARAGMREGVEAMLSVKIRAQLLDAQRASTERKPPSLLALLAILHERANQSGSATTEALVALAERALQREVGLDEPQAALRLLFALAGSAPAPASSRALGAAVHRAQQRFSERNEPPPNHWYPSVLVPRHTLTDGHAVAQPAVRVCAHLQEQQHSSGWARGDLALISRMRLPPQPSSLVGGVACAKRARRGHSGGGDGLLGALVPPRGDAPSRSITGLPLTGDGRGGACYPWHQGSAAASAAAAAATAADAAADAAVGPMTGRTAPTAAFALPTSPPPVGLRPPPLPSRAPPHRAGAVVGSVVPTTSPSVLWPGYLTDVPGSDGTFAWWLHAHFGVAAAAATELPEAHLTEHALTALCGRVSRSFIAADGDGGEEGGDGGGGGGGGGGGDGGIGSGGCSGSSSYSNAALSYARLRAVPQTSLPLVSAATLAHVMSELALAGSHAAALARLAAALTSGEHRHGAVAFAFGRTLARWLRGHARALAALPDAAALRQWSHDETQRHRDQQYTRWRGQAAVDHGDEDEDEGRDEGRAAAVAPVTSLLATLVHSAALRRQQAALVNLCFERLPAAAAAAALEHEGAVMGAAAGCSSAAVSCPSRRVTFAGAHDGAPGTDASRAGAHDGAPCGDRLPEGFPTGVALLNALHAELRESTGAVPGAVPPAHLWRLFGFAARPWLHWLRHALFWGKMSDPHGEFSAPAPRLPTTAGGCDEALFTALRGCDEASAVGTRTEAPPAMPVAAAFQTAASEGRAASRLLKLPHFLRARTEQLTECLSAWHLLRRSKRFARDELGWQGSALPHLPLVRHEAQLHALYRYREAQQRRQAHQLVRLMASIAIDERRQRVYIARALFTRRESIAMVELAVAAEADEAHTIRRQRLAEQRAMLLQQQEQQAQARSFAVAVSATEAEKLRAEEDARLALMATGREALLRRYR